MADEAGRIRLLTVIASSALGGAERNVVSLLGALDPSRFEISIACHGQGAMLEEYRRVATKVRSFDLLKVWRPTTVPTLVAWMQSIECDVVHTHLWTADLLGGLAAAVARVPVRVASVRGHYFLPVDVAGGLRWRRWLMSRGYRLVYRLFDRVIAVAPSIAADLVTRAGARVGAGKVDVIPSGIDLEEVRRASGEPARHLPSRRPLIVSVANLFPIKGTSVLIEAMGLVVERHSGAHLVLVGDGPERASLEGLVARLHLVSRVTFAGSRPDATALTAAADLVVLASLSEGTPRAILEALALERPLVATAVGGVPDLIVDGVTGRLAAPGKPTALADAMLELLGDPAGAREMSRKGRLHVAERFSLQQAARSTEAVYEHLSATVARRKQLR